MMSPKNGPLYSTHDSFVDWTVYDDVGNDEPDSRAEALESRARAVETYARQFYIPAQEGESLTAWFGRITARHAAMGPHTSQYKQMQPLLELIKAVVVAASGVSDDELDMILSRPAYSVPPSQQAVPVHSAPTPSVADPLAQRCGCGIVNCPYLPPAPRPFPTVHLDPAFRDALPGSPTTPADDSLLNPAPKGFEGADKLPFDSDYD